MLGLGPKLIYITLSKKNQRFLDIHVLPQFKVNNQRVSFEEKYV